MPFPTGYEEAKIGGGERLAPGGHKCEIRSMRAELSKAGNRMLVLEIDTDNNDSQPLFYINRYTAAYQAGKEPSWGGIYRVVVDERAVNKNGELYGLVNLKTLNTAITDSNPGYEINDLPYVQDSGNTTNEAKINMERYCEQFKGKKLGIVFREEEYKAQDGNIRTSVKPFYVCDYAKVLDEKVPAKKTLLRPAAGVTGAEGFMQVADGLDDLGLPFN